LKTHVVNYKNAEPKFQKNARKASICELHHAGTKKTNHKQKMFPAQYREQSATAKPEKLGTLREVTQRAVRRGKKQGQRAWGFFAKGRGGGEPGNLATA